jgi:hypothetical protein
MEPSFKSITASEWESWLAEKECAKRKVYQADPALLIGQHRGEMETYRGYHGREILELLQNAADAASAAGELGRVRLIITPHGLVVGNTGQPFDFQGVQSLLTANFSPKRLSGAALIGDKGLGFRSILNWTLSPLISSGELGIAFLPDYALEVENQLAGQNDEIRKLVLEERGDSGAKLIVPRLVFPKWIPDWENHRWPENEGLRSIATICGAVRKDGFNTVVGMPFSTPDAIEEAKRQVDELRQEFLLLVDSIDQLEIQVHTRGHDVWSCHRSEERCVIRKGNQDDSSWTVAAFHEELPGQLLDEQKPARSFQLTIAIPDDTQKKPGSLFCYFPTEVKIPLPLLAHATVELDATRKHVNNTPTNRYILTVLAEQIAYLAEQRVELQRMDPWVGCRLVTPAGAWGSEVEEFKIPEVLKNAARQKKLVPILNGGHLKASEARLAPGDEVKWWPQRLFPELAAVQNSDQRKLAVHLGVLRLPMSEIVEKLRAAELTLEERAKAIVGIIQGQNTAEPDDKNLSALLCDETGEPLQPGVSVMLQPSDEMPTLPRWAMIRFLHTELRRLLLEFLGVQNSSDLQRKLRAFGVKEYSSPTLMELVMKEAEHQVCVRPEDESLIRREALQFLWHIYRTFKSPTSCPAGITVKLENQEGAWTEPRKLYLGEGYGQRGCVTQDLYQGWSKGRLVLSSEQLGLGPVIESPNVVEFLGWLGVAQWPREIEAGDLGRGEYLDAVIAGLHYPVAFSHSHIVQSKEDLTYAKVQGAKTIDGISEIITKAPPEAVLAWLALDQRSATWLRPTRGHLYFYPGRVYHARCYSGDLPNYIRWQIETFPWLASTDETKKAPRDCLLIGGSKLEGLFPRPKQLNPEILKRYGAFQLNDALRIAGVKSSLAEYDRDDLYRLLLDMPRRSPEGKGSSALCRWLIDNESDLFGATGPYQEQFFRRGKVWGEREGKEDYFPLNDLRHIDEEGFPKALTENLAIAKLPKRTGKQKVKKILGINSLNRSEIIQNSISPEPSRRSEDWARWFNQAKPFIIFLRKYKADSTQSIELFQSFKLVVCDRLRVELVYEGKSYDHTAQEGEWFVSSTSKELYVLGDPDDSVDLLADAVGGAIASIFGLTSGDDFAKILRCEQQSRSKLLKRMGYDTSEEINETKPKLQESYAGPIEPPSDELQKVEPVDPLPQPVTENLEKNGSNVPDETKTAPSASPSPHSPTAPPAPKALVIREVKKSTSNRKSTYKRVDPERCEQLAESFEQQTQGRYALRVGHIIGNCAPGVDLLSFDSEADMTLFRDSDPRDWSKVRRFIEVKGRSSSTAKIDLKGNELAAAREHGDRYYIYRLYEESDGEFHISILQNPMSAEEAKTIFIEIDLDRARDTQRFDFRC